jgi:hypothetical protein
MLMSKFLSFRELLLDPFTSTIVCHIMTDKDATARFTV